MFYVQDYCNIYGLVIFHVTLYDATRPGAYVIILLIPKLTLSYIVNRVQINKEKRNILFL